METPTVNLLGARISRFGMERVATLVSQMVETGSGGAVCFANVHTVTESLKHGALKASLNGSKLSVADGLPLVWASRILGEPIESRVCGPDFMAKFLATNPDLEQGFVGGEPGESERIVNRFGLTEAKQYCSPFRPFSEKNLEEDLAEMKVRWGRLPRLVWIGLGAPKQELWAYHASLREPATVFMAVGAAFALLAGSRRRAPLWMQKSGLEWFFRLLQEPGRLWRRYLETNFRFVWELMKGRFLGRSQWN